MKLFRTLRDIFAGLKLVTMMLLYDMWQGTTGWGRPKRAGTMQSVSLAQKGVARALAMATGVDLGLGLGFVFHSWPLIIGGVLVTFPMMMQLDRVSTYLSQAQSQERLRLTVRILSRERPLDEWSHVSRETES